MRRSGYHLRSDGETEVTEEHRPARRCPDKDTAGLGLWSNFLEMKKISLPINLTPCSHAQTPGPTRSFLPPRRPLLPLVSEVHKGECGEGGDRERERAWAGGHVHRQPVPGCAQPKLGARKLLLFTRQLCRSRRQRRACPGLRPDFGKGWVLRRPGLGLKPCAWCGWGRWGAPLPRLHPPKSPPPRHPCPGAKGPGEAPPMPLTTSLWVGMAVLMRQMGKLRLRG